MPEWQEHLGVESMLINVMSRYLKIGDGESEKTMGSLGSDREA